MRWINLTLALLFLPLSAHAQDEDREAEMFGKPVAEEEPEIEPEVDPDPEQEMFGGEGAEPKGRLSEAEFADVLDETDDILDIGGQVYMRLNYNQYDPDPGEDSPGHTLSSPNILHLYLDARPNDRVRAFARGRLNYDFTIMEGDTNRLGETLDPMSYALDQLWIKFDIARAAYITFGPQTIRWGSGLFWNPTDFLNQQRRDPLAVLDERLGVSLLKLHIPIESLGWNLYAVANLEHADHPDEVGGALRAEILLGHNEIALTGAMRKDQPVRIGADISSGLGAFDFHLEGAVLYNEEKLFYRGEFDPALGIFPEAYSREDEWIPQLTAGTEFEVLYSDQDSLAFGLEFFFNDHSSGDEDLYVWQALNNDYTPLYAGRYYLAAFAMLARPGNWNDTTFTLSNIFNLSDSTGIARFDTRVTILTYLHVGLYASLYYGSFGEFRLEVDIPPIPEYEPFEDGLTVPANRMEVGLWLMLNI